MDKLKIVSFRMNEEMLSELDDFTKTHYYWKRSFIICAVIWAFLRLTSSATRFALIRHAFQKNPNFRIVLEEVKPMENKA